MKTGVELIAEERQRQIEQEGWTAEHDATHGRGELAHAAACYALSSYDVMSPILLKMLWPWTPEWWKPKKRLRDLVRAGALIAAEIDRHIQCEMPWIAPGTEPHEVEGTLEQRWFQEGAAQARTDDEQLDITLCPYGENTLAHHWWTRGYIRASQQFREFLARKAQSGEPL